MSAISYDEASGTSLSTPQPGPHPLFYALLELQADLMLMDDEKGAFAARAKGFEVTGTLGVLERAARRQLITLGQLKRTNFRYRQETMDALLAEHGGN